MSDCVIRENEVMVEVCNPGSDPKDLSNLKRALAITGIEDEVPKDVFVGRGIQIIKILSSSIQVLEKNVTVVRVIKKKIENEES